MSFDSITRNPVRNCVLLASLFRRAGVAGEPMPRETSSWHLPRQKPYHKHPRAITAAFATTIALPQAPANHHHGICQDNTLTTSTHGAFDTAFVKTKQTLPQAPAEPFAGAKPRHLPRQKPYHKHPQSLHHGTCQDKNLTTSTRGVFTTEIAKDHTLTTSTRGAFTTAFAKTKTLPQARAERLSRQKTLP